ncbi:DNA repair protein, partial [Streptomyces sp. 4F]
VEHILSPASVRPATLNEHAHVEHGRLTYPPPPEPS